MASQSLYRKWRSQTFSDLIGQEAITRTLLNAVREGRLAHAYLFCGPRGTGKTSTARLLAKAVNCANPHNGEPCNECVSCREITTGRSPDVIEIDAASNTGVDNIRDLRENVSLMGSGGHYRVFVIDEVHMLSTAAFNALLKTLEEPPPHVIFVLATTDAQKVLATVVSRCQRFDFRRITSRDIVARLNHVAQGEGLDLEPAAAELLARAAQGGLRDALSLLDQAMAYCGERIDLARTREMLGLSDTGTLRAILRAVAEEHPAEGLELINSLVTAGADLRQMQQQLAEEWRALMLARAGADLVRVLDTSEEDAREIAELARLFALDELMACARVFARNEAPARGLPVPQLALEIAFLECVAIRQGHGQGYGAPARVAAPAQTTNASVPLRATGTDAEPRPERRHTPPSESQPNYAPPQRVAPQREPQTEEVDLGAFAPQAVAPDMSGPTLRLVPTPPSAPQAIPERRSLDVPPPARGSAPTPWEADVADDAIVAAAAPTQNAGETSALINRVRQEWVMIRKVCKQKSAKVSALLNNARPSRVDAGSPPLLVLHAHPEFHYTALRKPESVEVVEWAIAQVLELPMRVRFELGSSNADGDGNGNGVSPRGPRPPQVGPSSSAGGNGYGGPGASGTQPSRGYGGDFGGEPEMRSASVPQGVGIREGRATPAPAAYEPTPATGTVSQASASRSLGNGAQREAPATAAATARQAALEVEVRNDPLVQELMRVCHVDLAEVLPLDEGEAEG